MNDENANAQVVTVTKKHEKDRNDFTFRGLIIDKKDYSSISFITMMLVTKNGTRTFVNHPRIMIFDKKLADKVDEVGLRVPVVVSGYITSRKEEAQSNVEKEDGKTQERGPHYRRMQSFVMTDIRKAEEADENESNNRITIVGTVNDTFVSKNHVVNLVVVSFRDGHYLKSINVKGFPKKDINYLDYMAAGTRVHIEGHCSTYDQRIEDGYSRTIETIVVDSIEPA